MDVSVEIGLDLFVEFRAERGRLVGGETAGIERFLNRVVALTEEEGFEVGPRLAMGGGDFGYAFE